MEPRHTADIPDTATGVHAAVAMIVRDALGKQVGDTLVRNSDVREALGVGVGTVQRALDLLAGRQALRTVSRGHLGRRVEAVDIGQCWQAAGLDPIRILLSPPGSVEINSLEAVVGDELVALGVPYTVRHVRGGNQRLQQLLAGQVDLTVVSAGTIDGLLGPQPATAPVLHRTLAPGTYYAPERLLVLTTHAAADPPKRIAIDRESFDHESLSLAQFPPVPGREYLQVPYPEVPAFVLAGLADAGIWHITTTVVPLAMAGLSARTMSGDEAVRTRDRLSGATVAVWSGRPELAAVLKALRLDALPAAVRTAVAAEEATAHRLAAARTGAARPGATG